SRPEAVEAAKKAQTVVKAEEAAKNPSTGKADSTENTSPVKQQLGFFSNKANAQSLVERLAEKGFDAEILEETRASGTTYFAVVVPENSQGTIGQNLKKAGFECYPVY
ncbi:MAG: SPOR domain-containing protein, partial [Spirochaetaceae bacterium]|nr:SPOR domain-containing protein [Spirochaetaceae bacterium]